VKRFFVDLGKGFGAVPYTYWFFAIFSEAIILASAYLPKIAQQVASAGAVALMVTVAAAMLCEPME